MDLRAYCYLDVVLGSRCRGIKKAHSIVDSAEHFLLKVLHGILSLLSLPSIAALCGSIPGPSKHFDRTLYSQDQRIGEDLDRGP